MDQGKRLVVNTVCNVSAFLTHVVIGIVLAPFILSELGQTTYGIWALTGSLLAYSSLLSLGLNSAVNRWLPMYLVKKDFEGINRVVNTTIYAYLVSAVVLASAVVLLVFVFPEWFHIAPELRDASRWTVGLIGAGFVVFVALNVSAAILSGVQRYDLMAACDVAGDVCRAVGIVAVLWSGFGLVALALVAGLSLVIRCSLKAVFARARCPELRIDLSLASWATFREMFAYSINTLMYSCGQIIQQQAALILVGLLLTTSAVTEYAMPLIIVGMMAQLVTTGSAVMKPAATQMEAEDRMPQLQKLYLLGTKYALLIALPLLVFLLAFAEDALRIWLRDDFMATSPRLLTVLAVGATFRLWHLPAFFVVVGLGKHRMFGLITLLSAISAVTLGIILASGFGMGVKGVALGFAVPEVVIAVGLITPYCCRSVGIPVWREIRSSLIPAVLGTVPFVLATAALRSLYRPSSLLHLTAVGAILAVPLLIGWWIWGFSADEKRRFAGLIPTRKAAGTRLF